jgi:hypothetical protein
MRHWAGGVFIVSSGDLRAIDDELGGNDDLPALEGGFHQVAFGDARQTS